MKKVASIKEGLCRTWLPLLEIQVQDLYICLIIDTGSTHCVLDRNVADLLEERINIVGENRLHGIDGNFVNASEGILNFKIDEKEYKQAFCFRQLGNAFSSIKNESGIEVHGILGNNFLVENKWIIDYGKFEIYEFK